jgi:hypothetical protein
MEIIVILNQEIVGIVMSVIVMVASAWLLVASYHINVETKELVHKLFVKHIGVMDQVKMENVDADSSARKEITWRLT